MNSLTIGIPVGHSGIHWQTAQSLIDAVKHPGFNILTYFVESPNIEENRNFLARTFKTEYLLMVDSDMVFTPQDVANIFHRACGNNLDLLCGLFFTGEPYKPAIYQEDNFDNYLNYPEDKVFGISGCGMAFTIIHRRVFEAIEKPFNRLYPLSEDLSFCFKVNKKFKLWCDSSIKIGHLKTLAITVDDFKIHEEEKL